MPVASRSRRRSRATLAAVVVGLAVVLTGCSNPGSVNDYNADTKQNFLDACTEANSNLPEDRELEVCQCWYDLIEGDDGLSFDTFKKTEEDIRVALEENQLNSDDDLRRIAPDYFELLDDSTCLTAGP